MATAQSVIRFQDELLIPTLIPRYAELLDLEQWMGFMGHGISWKDLTEQEADELYQWMGPSAFKAIRFSADIISIIRSSKPIVVAGGSCLITTADGKYTGQKEDEISKLIKSLPNLTQITDPMLPIAGADMHLDILEDSLFADHREHLLSAFQEQGQRHLHMFSRFADQHGVHGEIKPCYFSALPMQKKADEFFNGLKSFRRAPLGFTRSQVIWSFTGSWADTLREHGIIPRESEYLVVEPYHHFTEAMYPLNDSGSNISILLMMFKEYLLKNGYGKNDNSGVAGGIAFFPYVQADGRLGFANTTSSQTCCTGKREEFLASRLKTMDITRVPALVSDDLYADGLNCLYMFPECREALYAIHALWQHIENESTRACAHIPTYGISVKQRRQAVKEATLKVRASHELMCTWKNQHDILYAYLTRMIRQVF
ncbi:hypothetical protein KKH24_02345 [Patescibacteria group bacterium]|nr:hypothetical protein [Patescibacteria group bacterium]